MKTFDLNKKYHFSKELALTVDGDILLGAARELNKDTLEWLNYCDGKEVEVLSSDMGKIDRSYVVCADWCVEVDDNE